MTTLSVSELSELLQRPPLKINLIGVAGSGMSGIAGLLLNLGHTVSGSDRVSSLETRRLESIGLKFDLPQTAETVHGADLVVYSSAVKSGNPAYDEAVRLGLRLVRRAEALAAIMALKEGIVIAGMHGKTTTSSMAAHVLRAGGLRPSHYVGAEIPILGTNAHWDPSGELFVAEGDESDGTIRLYRPRFSIVLNIEEEHLDYYKDLDAIEDAFRQLIDQTSAGLIYCWDDEHTRRICSAHPHAISYGCGNGATYRYETVEPVELGSRFSVWRGKEKLGDLTLGVPGVHNVSNAVAVVALADQFEVPFSQIATALASFRGARRRFEIRYQSPDFVVVDDYAHHPTEITATLETARNLGRKRLVAVFQPHRYSRTQALRNQFGAALRLADTLFVTDVYPASEPPIPGVDGSMIASAVSEQSSIPVFYVPKRTRLHREVARQAEEGDLILSLGAGDIHEEAGKLAVDLQIASELRESMGAGVINLYEPLSKHTTLRVGGPAQFWLEPETRGGLANVLEYCNAKRLPLFVIGRGSNLLVRDGGVPGVVLHLNQGDFVQIRFSGDEVSAGAGVRLKQLVGACRRVGLGGFEWMEGIPGSVGGSLRMNAGALGTETFEHVLSVQTVDRSGRFEILAPAQLDVSYRSVAGLFERIAVSAIFRGVARSPHEIDALLAAAAHKRKTTQPIAASAGCIFKNPPQCPAGKLIDELGLKNSRVGEARVSEIHGNFIVNNGGARARDVLELIGQIQAVAKRERGIELQPEIQVIGIEES
jgi:UDP-N-acetylmuramate--L-alanine ligase/UDP-N-acetylenolpyruvoylglucosamine reductase